MKTKMKKFLVVITAFVMAMTTVIPTAAAEMEVTGTDYAALQAVIDSAASGDTVKLTDDIDMGGETLVIASDDKIVLDLNGHTISGLSDVANHKMIHNLGHLTVTGNGVITYAYTGVADTTYGKGNYTVVNSGTMIVENGKIKNTTAAMSHMFVCIDNNSTSYDTSLTINGGSIICENYRSIRQFANSTTKKNDLIINGGEIVGQVWAQSPNNKANLATITITGGTIEPVGKDGSAVYVTNSENGDFDVKISGGHFNGKIGTDKPTALKGAITGGTFTEDAKNGTNADLFSNNFALTDNGDGTFSVIKKNANEVTTVEYVGQGVEEYEISVPAKLVPGASGNVVVSGTWSEGRKLTVTTPDKVTLTHNVKKSNTKVLDIVFDKIEKIGDNCYAVAADGKVSVSEITNALFGTWTGTIVYNVSFSDVK